MKILEICGLLGIPLSLFGWIGSCFLTAYIKEKGIRTAWEKIKEIIIKILLFLLLVIGIACLIINISRINPNSLNILDVITICFAIVTLAVLSLCLVLLRIFYKIADNMTSLQKIVSRVVDYIGILAKKMNEETKMCLDDPNTDKEVIQCKK